MHYGFVGGENVFGSAPDAQRETPRGVWRPYGGHRVWVAPERFPETYTIDNRPPLVESGERHAVLRRARDSDTGLAVELQVELQPDGTDVIVRNVVVNDGSAPQRIAPWGITIVRSGGVTLIPNATYRPHKEALQAARSVILWRYTDLSDERFAFGPAFLRLRCDPARTQPTKIGVSNERGWFAYLVDGTAFVVRTSYDAGAQYPDRGASVEAYTEGGYCEVETLGPLVTLAPGAQARHVTRWSLVAGIDADDDVTLARVLGNHVGE